MSKFSITKGALLKGVWIGHVSGPKGADAPALTVLYQDKKLEDVSLASDPAGGWELRIPVPARAISDGLHCFAIFEQETRIGDFTLIGGEAVGEDIRAEVELLRAELDLLKRAFRRHCEETA